MIKVKVTEYAVRYDKDGSRQDEKRELIHDVVVDYDEIQDHPRRKGLFRFLQKEYGRFTSHIFQDRDDGTVRKVGWAFERKLEYNDNSDKKYIHETIVIPWDECGECGGSVAGKGWD